MGPEILQEAPATVAVPAPQRTVPKKGSSHRQVVRRSRPSTARTPTANAATDQYTPYIGLLALMVIKSASPRG